MHPKQATAPATAQILTVGSTRFAANARALVDTLFNPDGTANGLFRVRKNGVLFSRPDGEAFAFLVANPGQSRFFVSARRQNDGPVCGIPPYATRPIAFGISPALSSQ